MGAYMSTPITEKESSDEVHDHIEWGVSGMQGWRTSMEDAHCCLPDIDNKKNSMFGVFDGHGGREVAEYCAKNLSNFLLDCDAYNEGDIETALHEAFLNIDEAITTDEVIKELQEICGGTSDREDDDEDEDEAAMLLEEANMPIEQLIQKFKGSVKETLKKNGILESGSEDDEIDDIIVPNGHSKEANDEKPSKAGSKNSTMSRLKKVTGNDEKSENSSSTNTEQSSSSKSTSNETDQSSPSKSSSNETDQSLPSKSSSTEQSSKVAEEGTGSSSTNQTSDSPIKSNKKDTPQQDSTDEDDETEEDDASEEEASSDEESEEEDDEFEDGEGMEFQQGSDEVGKDSGTTAIVSVIHKNILYVANAGDSRCVLCRNGKALEMSIDHKPEDETEKKRIEHAGGKITGDGRVMGGLNLSRAIGDHTYKQNKDLPLKDQMITALPDIRKIELSDEDDYMVLACDGIWNVMTNEEVIEFVNDKLASDEKPSLSKICEELFDTCLAPNTENDGTGCDNMTCMIVRFKHDGDKTSTQNNTSNKLSKKSTKRTVSDSNETSSDSKRVKLNEMD